MTAAERMRAYRGRRAAGLAVFRIEVRLEQLSDALLAREFLKAWDADDRDEVELALQRMIETFITSAGCDA
ncbi:MAG TPA: hypothetical protein VFC26_01390 [Verrucomicrobiae bacterium]|jgi:hypothetical protein|nr:hypothetical protein [Verrucomicrobiae bacterium]